MKVRHLAIRQHEFCAGHRVFGHESKCAHVHGHGYVAHFICEADGLDSIGRVIDFSAIKSKLCQWLEDNWDHKLVLWHLDPLAEKILELEPNSVVTVPFNPTAENMAEYLLLSVGPNQLKGTGVVLVKVILEETRKCHASAQLEDKNLGGLVNASFSLDEA